MIAKSRLEEIRACLQRVYGGRLKGVVVYGSEARGEARADSDIDLLVLLEGPVHLWQDLQAGVKAVLPLSLEYDRPISPKPVDVRAYEAAQYPLYANAKREGIRV